MLVKMAYLCKRFGFGYNTIRVLIDRAEFAKYRKGGIGGLFFDLNNDSLRLLEKFLKLKKARKKGINNGNE